MPCEKKSREAVRTKGAASARLVTEIVSVIWEYPVLGTKNIFVGYAQTHSQTKWITPMAIAATVSETGSPAFA